MKKLSTLDKIFFLLNNGAAILLLGAYLSQYVSPELFTPIAFLGLAFPFLLLTNVLFVFYWAFKLKRHLLLSLLVIALGWGFSGRIVQVDGSDSTDKNTIKVLSYNVRLFDLYNWSNNTKTRNKILTFISHESPQIMCLQEFFYASNKDYFNTLDTLLEMQDAKNYHAQYSTGIRNAHYFGIATFSQYPIIKKGQVPLHNGVHNICIYSDLVIGPDTLRVYNMHLASIRLDQEDYEFIQKISESENEERIRGSKQIFKRLTEAFVRRASQSETIAAHIEQSPYPVLVCGDFNDVPLSYAYRCLSAGLKDAFVESGFGLGSTYNGNLPSMRIDYILHSEELRSYDYNSPKEDLSDHFPIMAEIEL